MIYLDRYLFELCHIIDVNWQYIQECLNHRKVAEEFRTKSQELPREFLGVPTIS